MGNKLSISPLQPRLHTAKTTLSEVACTTIAMTIAILAYSASFSTNAQTYRQDNSRYERESYVSVYEDCYFKGQRRDIAVGQFSQMRQLDLGNDTVSSIRVPRELEAVIFEDDNFRGDYARINKDVRCFDGSWNDRVSSLKVTYSDNRQYNNASRNRPIYTDGRHERDYRHLRGDRDTYPSKQINDGVTGLNVSEVRFNNSWLKRVDRNRWQIRNGLRKGAYYAQVKQDRTELMLQNEYSSERIKINLVDNYVAILGPRGGQQKFPIESRKALEQLGPDRRGPDTNIAGQCFDYFVYTNGKSGGIRFSNGKDFFRFNDRGHRGRICHRGDLLVEINKRDFDTDVTLEIGNKRFKFAAGEKETQYRASWYRKRITLQVGR